MMSNDTKIKQVLWIALAVAATHGAMAATGWPEGFPEKARERTQLVTGWEFQLDQGQGGFKKTVPTEGAWEKVTVPHTLKLASYDLDGTGDDEYQLTFHRWIGWYKCEIRLTAPLERRVFIEFEGAHQVTRCWVNGQYIGEHAVGGYTPFHFDISAAVRRDGSPNEVVLAVDNRRQVDIPPEGDRYDFIKWGGIYRDVYLVVTDPVYVTFPWEDTFAGVFVTTPTVTPQDATVNIRTQVRNTAAEARDVAVVTRVVNADGCVVLRMERSQAVPAGGTALYTQTGGLAENVRLWGVDHPYLYRVNTQVVISGQVVDCVENPLGLRRIEFIPGRGCVINGEDVELIGVNRHQGMVFIGDAVPDSLHWKDAWQIKQAGFNSVRLAHYPHDNAFLRACDRLGLLVYEEPPSWIGLGSEKWFDNLEEATRRMIRNHRNHPSVIMWAASVNHRGPVERLHYAAKEEDPTRPTASNGAPWTGPRNSGVTEIYSPMDYNNTPVPPDEFTFLCEHGTSVNAATNQFEVSKSRRMPNMIGVACWTAHDYQSLKGKGFFSPSRPWSAFRVPNPVYYWYQSELTAAPMVHIADERAATGGRVLVFSNAARVDLYQDGARVASQGPDVNPDTLHVRHPSFTFDHAWTGGELTAKALVNGRVVATHARRTPGKAARLRVAIETDEAPFEADGSSIKLVQAYIEDESGTLVTDSDLPVTFSVSGSGDFIAAPGIEANPALPRFGTATGYLRSGRTAGELVVTATAPGLTAGSDRIVTCAFDANRVRAEALPIYHLKRERLDLSSTLETVAEGNAPAFEFGTHRAGTATSQFLQFGWTAWVGHHASRETHTSEVYAGLRMELSGVDGELDWFCNWGLVANLPYLGIDGVQMKPGGSFRLELTGLPAGTYQFKSYHHQQEEIRKAVPSLRIGLSDAAGVDRPVVEGLRISSGADLFNKAPASAGFTLTANGRDPVVVTFSSHAPKIGVVLNGFELAETLPAATSR